MSGPRASVKSASEPYLRLLAITGADEAHIRRLSVLPLDVEIPAAALQRIEEIRATDALHAGRENADHDPWESVALLGGLLFIVVSLLTLVTVYVVVIFGGDFAQTVAQIGGAIAALILAVSAFGSAASSLREGAVVGVVIAGSVALVSIALSVLTVWALAT